MTEEEKEKERANDRARKRKSRALRSFDEDEVERAQSRERKRIKRQKMSEEEKERERAIDRERKRRLRQIEINRKIINNEMVLLLAAATPEQITEEVNSTMNEMLTFLQLQDQYPHLVDENGNLIRYVSPYVRRRTKRIYKDPSGEKRMQRERLSSGEPKAPRKKHIDGKDSAQKKVDKENAYLLKARDKKRVQREQLGILEPMQQDAAISVLDSHTHSLLEEAYRNSVIVNQSQPVLSIPIDELQQTSINLQPPVHFNMHSPMGSTIGGVGVPIGTVMLDPIVDSSVTITVVPTIEVSPLMPEAMPAMVPIPMSAPGGDSFAGKFYQV